MIQPQRDSCVCISPWRYIWYRHDHMTHPILHTLQQTCVTTVNIFTGTVFGNILTFLCFYITKSLIIKCFDVKVQPWVTSTKFEPKKCLTSVDTRCMNNQCSTVHQKWKRKKIHIRTLQTCKAKLIRLLRIQRKLLCPVHIIIITWSANKMNTDIITCHKENKPWILGSVLRVYASLVDEQTRTYEK